MSKVKFTIFIPVINVADTIERAILSVLNQDYENKELIVLDGGSTDGTVEIVKRYLDRIAYFTSGPDESASKSIAESLVHATGDLVNMIGADDFFNPGALSAAAKTYEETHADVIYGDVSVISTGDKPRHVSYRDVDLEKLYIGCAIQTNAAFVKKELLQEHYTHYFSTYGGKLKIIGTDHYLWLRLYHAGRSFAYIQSEEPLTNFSLTGVSSSRLYQVLLDDKRILQMVVGPKSPDNAPYYQAFERRFAAYCVDFYSQIVESDRFCQVIDQVTGGAGEYILFGAGDVGKRFSTLLKNHGYRVRYFVDNHPERTDGIYMGIPVRPPKALLAERDVNLLISTVHYDEEIFRQLQEMRLDPSVRVMTHDDFSMKIYEMLGQDILDDAFEKGNIQ